MKNEEMVLIAEARTPYKMLACRTVGLVVRSRFLSDVGISTSLLSSYLIS